MQSDNLMEKVVILDEVNALTSQLRDDAASARPVGASLAAAANAYQERLRRVTRGMMATISELSLYQVCFSVWLCEGPLFCVQAACGGLWREKLYRHIFFFWCCAVVCLIAFAGNCPQDACHQGRARAGAAAGEGAAGGGPAANGRRGDGVGSARAAAADAGGPQAAARAGDSAKCLGRFVDWGKLM